jgi:hypothetical protein
MPKRGELFKASIIDRDSTQALYLTCSYIIKKQYSFLEDEWINMSSHIGKKDAMPFGKTWNIINKDLVELIESDEFHIQKALLCTTKLMLLNQRDIDTHKTMHVQRLRNMIIGCFPDKASLSEVGKQMFQRILPPENHEHYSFYNRILAGFSKLFSDENYDDMHNGLEYISRKKLILPMINIWPAPSDTDASIGDPCWLLWGALLLYYKNNENIATNFKLFSSNWRKNIRNDRIGLLWGIPYCIQESTETIWTDHDITIFEKVKNITSELWNFALNEHKKPDIKSESEFETSEKKNIHDFYNSFIPRKQDTLEPSTTIQYTNYDPYNGGIANSIVRTVANEVKSVTISGKGLEEYGKNKESLTRVKKLDSPNNNNETSRSHTRGKWLYPSS